MSASPCGRRTGGVLFYAVFLLLAAGALALFVSRLMPDRLTDVLALRALVDGQSQSLATGTVDGDGTGDENDPSDEDGALDDAQIADGIDYAVVVREIIRGFAIQRFGGDTLRAAQELASATGGASKIFKLTLKTADDQLREFRFDQPVPEATQDGIVIFSVTITVSDPYAVLNVKISLPAQVGT